MLTQERQSEIVKILDEKGSVKAQELKEVFQVSESTIRRDLTELDAFGKITKVFGGAIKKERELPVDEPEVANKQGLNVQSKRIIGQYAAQLIKPKDFVYIDAGTSTEYMLEFIKEKTATYVTNAFEHAKFLSKKGLSVILIGGKVKATTEALVGAEAIGNLSKYHFNIGFFGVNGLTLGQGCTTPDPEEAEVKRCGVSNTKKSYVLADHGKFGKICPVTFAEYKQVIIITDQEVDAKFEKQDNIIVVK